MSPGSTSVTGSLSFRIGFRALNRMLYPSSLAAPFWQTVSTFPRRTPSACVSSSGSPVSSAGVAFIVIATNRTAMSSKGRSSVPSSFGFAFTYNRSMVCSTMVSHLARVLVCGSSGHKTARQSSARGLSDPSTDPSTHRRVEYPRSHLRCWQICHFSREIPARACRSGHLHGSDGFVGLVLIGMEIYETAGALRTRWILLHDFDADGGAL